MNTAYNPALRELFRLSGRAPARSRIALCLASFGLIWGCSAYTGPRVLEVTNRTRLQDVDFVDRNYFIEDRASLIKYQPQDLSIEDQREEFYVRWTPRTVSLVRFEYRQVGKPVEVFEQTYVPHKDARNLFEVRGEQFRSGGVVSAWRVSLWDGDKVVAEKKSVMW
jgi:hypothetical protein